LGVDRSEGSGVVSATLFVGGGDVLPPWQERRRLMKITCPSCSARYSIDDAKVKGKAFKFTCKKCGQTHVYRGTADGSATAVPAGAPAGAAPGGQAPPPASAGGEEEAVWYVAVGEEQQGPYTTQQIREYIQTDQLDPESFMWKEGMEDWLPVQQIAEFSDVYQGGAPAAAPSPSPASAFSGPTADEVTVASPFSPAAPPTRATCSPSAAGRLRPRRPRLRRPGPRIPARSARSAAAARPRSPRVVVLTSSARPPRLPPSRPAARSARRT
jgi:predicted Zn finger-like uncharacterized protein